MTNLMSNKRSITTSRNDKKREMSENNAEKGNKAPPVTSSHWRCGLASQTEVDVLQWEVRGQLPKPFTLGDMQLRGLLVAR